MTAEIEKSAIKASKIIDLKRENVRFSSIITIEKRIVAQSAVSGIRSATQLYTKQLMFFALK